MVLTHAEATPNPGSGAEQPLRLEVEPVARAALF
jgi:hypothetical protein